MASYIKQFSRHGVLSLEASSEEYQIFSKNWDKNVVANSADLDQTAKEQSDRDLYCLPFKQEFDTLPE